VGEDPSPRGDQNEEGVLREFQIIFEHVLNYPCSWQYNGLHGLGHHLEYPRSRCLLQTRTLASTLVVAVSLGYALGLSIVLTPTGKRIPFRPLRIRQVTDRHDRRRHAALTVLPLIILDIHRAHFTFPDPPCLRERVGEVFSAVLWKCLVELWEGQRSFLFEELHDLLIHYPWSGHDG
jgi:hypothetical protein